MEIPMTLKTYCILTASAILVISIAIFLELLRSRNKK